MLKAERFQLFAEVTDDRVVGEVKSQSSKDLVYSCRLASDGRFGCCTQNLNVCGGLRGALCKHLLVLIVGLAKADQLDPTKLDWRAVQRLGGEQTAESGADDDDSVPRSHVLAAAHNASCFMILLGPGPVVPT